MKRFFLLIPFVVALSCNNKKNTPADTPTSGTIKIAVDETLSPVIKEEIDVFESIYFTAKIKDTACSEIDAFNLLLQDSVRMIIAARTLSEEEKAFFTEKKIFPKEVKIATDAIAFITNRMNPDSVLTVKNIRDILMGKIRKWDELNAASKIGEIKTVFDNPNSGTAEYAVKTICNNQALSENLSALNSNSEVINFVANTPGALGIIGVNWISNHRDTTCMGFQEKIQVVAVCPDSTLNLNNAYRPFQAYLATRQYPFTRDIYAILADPRIGLTSGFTSFITSDRGQRIILKAGVLPVTQPVRIIQVNDQL